MPSLIRTALLVVSIATGVALVIANPEPATTPEVPTGVAAVASLTGVDVALAQTLCIVGISLVSVAALVIAWLAWSMRTPRKRRPRG